MITAQAKKQKCNVVEKHEPSTDSPFIPILLPRSKICLNESSHAPPFEEICC